MDDQYRSGFNLEDNAQQGTKYFSFNLFAKTIEAFMDVSFEGVLRLIYTKHSENWKTFWEAPAAKNPCDKYGACGPFGVCKSSESPICKCLKGFVPKSHEEWSRGNRAEGEECKIQCLSNCSCLAYVYVDNIGCLIWSNELIDIQEFSSNGEDIFIRLQHTKSGQGKRTKLIAGLSAICFINFLVAIVYVFHRLQANRRVAKLGNIKATAKFEHTDLNENSSGGTVQEYIREHERSELFLYRFDSISIATNNFSIPNKLGEGGFVLEYVAKWPTFGYKQFKRKKTP
ncbi:G-type lectin S-receptor-like serine/threonine-protein kinase At1g61480 [Malus domestica]|uniref:G-type lectin S-receptor-like serine/threonine-protein kinase At1g61480 n=1 Tax=Malus domestica TaxID=3750 RepID=UPI0039764469